MRLSHLHIMYFDHPSLLSFSQIPSRPPPQFRLLFSFYLLYSSLSKLVLPYSAGVWGHPLSMGDLRGTTALKNTDSPFSRSHQLSWSPYFSISPRNLIVAYIFLKQTKGQESFAYAFDIRKRISSNWVAPTFMHYIFPIF